LNDFSQASVLWPAEEDDFGPTYGVFSGYGPA